ncbi:CDP-alcohol phosphatidyltransferase family protein [Quadrisphaera setariae]|nr:CDP-alcohol phosphatidyltransferase family protein [Quadrisphaera setariae]
MGEVSGSARPTGQAARADGDGSARRDALLTVLAAAVVCALVSLTSVMPGGGHRAALAAGTGTLLVGVAALGVARRRDGWSGPADRVTLLRTVLGGGVATLVALDLLRGELGSSWPVVLLAAPALALDAVDGAVARRTRTASAAGARLDMEVDAALIAVLCLPSAAVVGWWVLAIGGMRYAWVAVGAVWPPLRGQLAPLFSRKLVAAVQGVVLAAVAVPGLPQPLAVVLAAGALASLAWSFGRDGLTLVREDRCRG